MNKEEANFFGYEISNISQEVEKKESNSNDEIYLLSLRNGDIGDLENFYNNKNSRLKVKALYIVFFHQSVIWL